MPVRVWYDDGVESFGHGSRQLNIVVHHKATFSIVASISASISGIDRKVRA